MEQCALTFPGTIAFYFHMVWETALLFLPLPVRLEKFSLPSPRSSRLLGLALRPSRSCLSMRPGSLCHTGDWHLRRKRRAGLFYVSFFIVVFFRFFTFADWYRTASNEGTGGMESSEWKVVLYCPNRAPIRSHSLIVLPQIRWIIMTGRRTSKSLQPMFKLVWIVVPCCRQATASSTLWFKHV